MTLSIVIPAKNEEKRIVSTLDDLNSYISSKQLQKEVEIIVVVNNSTDKTLEIAKDYANIYPYITYINAPFYTGKGGAITLGFQKARNEYVAFVDADGSSKSEEIFKLFNVLTSNKNIDGAIASRHLIKGLINGEQPFTRRLFGNLFRLLVQILFKFNYKDTQCGLKIFKKDIAKYFADKISTIGWTFDINLLILSQYNKYNIVEIPTQWEDKKGSHLQILPTILNVLQELITLKRVETALYVQKLTQPNAQNIYLPRYLVNNTISKLNNKSTLLNVKSI